MRGQRHYGIVTIGDDIIAQASQCIANLRFAVKGANSSLADVVRVRYVLPNARDFEATSSTVRATFAEAHPAATMIPSGLADPRVKIETDVDAIITDMPGPGPRSKRPVRGGVWRHGRA